jgi:acetyl-CoA carboxylase carboxyltransferase component
MSAGSFHASFFTAAWPTGEFGAMGIEGAIKLAYAKQLQSIADKGERKALFDDLVAKAYEKGKALNVASFHEIDAVIDPAKSREWILAGLRSTPKVEKRKEKKRSCIDTW